MLPLCRAEGIGVIPWSPLARGRLARPWEETTKRKDQDPFGKSLYEPMAEADRGVVERVAAVATQRKVPMAQVALAWVLQKSPVTAPIIGATRLQHLDDAAAALSIELTAEEVAQLEDPYVPHPVLGFR
jgi:aryl-alcohol dehydrogenase-like predicted oxidoreductase